MRKYLSKLNVVKLFFLCIWTVSCASTTINKPLVEPLDASDKTFQLKLGAFDGRSELSKYFSHSFVKTFEDQQLTRERDEIVEFEVEVKTLRVDKQNGFIFTISKTVEKDGLVDLHDLAFPEVNERIEVVYKENAEVVYAGGFPKSSVFYVPPLSLPDGPVKVGATWEMQRSWVSMKNNIPLHISIVSIFKNVFPCGQDTCADIEVSGNVGIIATMQPDVDFKSNINGRILFSIGKGTVLWSMVKSQESLAIQGNRVDVQSCLTSNLVTPEQEKWPYVAKAKCDPKNDSVENIPGTLVAEEK